MAMVRITEAELARDLHAVLEKVRQGVEIVVERNHRLVSGYQNATNARPEDQRMHRSGEGA
jgi:hypothetical protein